MGTAENWHEFLSKNEIPPTRYFDCFDVFTRGERQIKFTVYDLRESWIRIGNKSRETYIPISDSAAQCGGCSGTGWTNKELSQSSATGQREWQLLRGGGVKPCSCSVGRRYDRSYDLGVEDNRRLRVNTMSEGKPTGEKMSPEGIKAEIEKLKQKMAWT